MRSGYSLVNEAPHREFERFLAAHVTAGDWPGGVYAVGPPAAAPRWMGAFGRVAEGPASPPATPETLYDLASLTKGLSTTLIALRLAGAGRIDLDRPLDDVLPELAGYAGATPTLASLLAHTAGFPAWAPLYRLASDPSEAIRALASLPPAAPAGARPVYSCPGSIAAGVALERLGSASLRDLFRTHVLEPLGIEGEDLGFSPVPPDRAAPTERGRAYEHGLAGEGTRGLEVVPGDDAVIEGVVHDGNAAWFGGAAGNAGLFGTALAVFRVLSAVEGGGGFLERSAALSLATLHARSEDEARTLGFQHGSAPSAPVPGEISGATDSYGHVGFTGTSAWVFSGQGVVAVLLTNRVHPVRREAPVQSWRREFHRIALRAGRP